jgi:hypothetical protein
MNFDLRSAVPLRRGHRAGETDSAADAGLLSGFPRKFVH